MRIDPRWFRTELLAPGPYGDPAQRWSLFVDGQLVADTDPDLTNIEAQHWARRCLGEGVEFLPVPAVAPTDPAQTFDWVANPTSQQPRHEEVELLDELDSHQPDSDELDSDTELDLDELEP